MTNTPFREEEFSFRFTKLSLDAADRLRKSLGGFKIESRRPDVVSLRIGEATNLEPLYAFLEREAFEPGTYSIWVSLVTSSDHGGVSLPGYILDLARRARAGVDFSFVACLDEADAQAE
jgi:hypothetical protein